MKYLEIYFNERFKEIEQEQEKIINCLKDTIEKGDIADLNDVIFSYALSLEDTFERKEEILRLKDNLLGGINVKNK